KSAHRIADRALLGPVPDSAAEIDLPINASCFLPFAVRAWIQHPLVILDGAVTCYFERLADRGGFFSRQRETPGYLHPAADVILITRWERLPNKNRPFSAGHLTETHRGCNAKGKKASNHCHE